jgi:deoxycytidylate deaminase
VSLSVDELTNLGLARNVATASPCSVKIGAILVPENGSPFLGYNTVPRLHPHAADDPKIGCDQWCQRRMKTLYEAPEEKCAGYTDCPTVHAEAMALARAGKDAVGGTLYVTGPPCMQCAKLIAFYRVRRLVCWTTPEMTKDRSLPKVVEYLSECGVEVRPLVDSRSPTTSSTTGPATARQKEDRSAER